MISEEQLQEWEAVVARLAPSDCDLAIQFGRLSVAVIAEVRALRKIKDAAKDYMECEPKHDYETSKNLKIALAEYEGSGTDK